MTSTGGVGLKLAHAITPKPEGLGQLGFYGPLTRSRGKELLGREFPEA
jgi:hypothetical protein